MQMRKSEGQADMQQEHVGRNFCDCVQRMEGEGEEGWGHGCGQLDGQVHLQPSTHTRTLIVLLLPTYDRKWSGPGCETLIVLLLPTTDRKCSGHSSSGMA